MNGFLFGFNHEWQPDARAPTSSSLLCSRVFRLSPFSAQDTPSPWMSSIQKHFPKSPIASRTSLQIMYPPTNKGTNDTPVYLQMIKYAQNHIGPTGCQGPSFILINRLHSAIFPLWKFLTEESYVLLVSNPRSGCGQSCDCVDHSRRFVCGSVRCPTRNCVSSAVRCGTWSLGGARKCPVAIAGHLHLLIDRGQGSWDIL